MLQISNIIIPDTKIRRLFRQEIGRSGYSQVNIMGIAACRAAYSEGGEWLQELLVYLQENISCPRATLQTALERLERAVKEGTSERPSPI